MKYSRFIFALPIAGVSIGGCDYFDHGWTLAGYDHTASNFNNRERTLHASNVDDLVVEWVFDESVAGRTVRPMHATPIVDGQGNAYVGDFGGVFFSVSAEGTLRWTFTADPAPPEMAALLSPELGVSEGSPFLGGAALAATKPYVIVGDANGRIYARHRDTGAEVWTARALDDHPLGGVAGNALAVFGDVIVVGMSSLENYALVLSQAGIRVDCCTHQGAVVALDLETGTELWRYNTSQPAAALPEQASPFLFGPSGAGIWSQPSFDPSTATIYVSTGQNLSPDATGGSTPTSDAIIALDATTGAEKWVHQFTENDIWAVGVPNPHPVSGQLLDMDLGDSPKLYRLKNGRRVVGAGQKDGRYHVVDAETGALVNSEQIIAPRNDLGGFQTGGAHAYQLAFQHGLDATEGFTSCNDGNCPYQGFEGVVVALSEDGSDVVWRFGLPASPLVGGLAVANGLVFFQSPVDEELPGQGDPLWGLYALRASSGEVKGHLQFAGRAIGSPVVADGHVYVTAGNGALPAYGIVPQGSLLRLGLAGSSSSN